MQSAAIRNKVLLICLAILPVAAYANELSDGTITIPRSGQEIVSMPSPEAAALCRHLDHSIDYSTGRVSINIPLYTYNCGGITMPVSISYQTGGIKADAEEGALGLGWELNYGGFVSRSVVGRPDDAPNQAFLSESPWSVSFEQLEALHCNNADALYDRYSYCAGACTGSFIIRPNGTIVQLHKTDVRIERTSAGFEITVPDGTLYRFDIPERLDYTYIPASMDNTYISQNYQCTCMWRLSKVLSPSRTDSLVYTYGDVNSKTISTTQRTIATSWDSQSLNPKWSHPSNDGLVSTSNHTYTQRHRLAKITGRAGSIEFSYAAIGGERCTGLTVKNLYGTIVRSVSFSSGRTLGGYRISDSAGNMLDGADFSYYPDPNSHNKAKDFFGYRNGGGNRSNPGYDIDSLGISNNAYESVVDKLLRFSWRRNPVFNYTVAESLKTISTMAGTVTQFEYEPSDAGAFMTFGRISPGLRLKKETVTDSNTGNIRVRELEYCDAVPSVDFSALCATDFVSVSGMYSGTSATPFSRYTTGASIAASCRLQGSAPESACVYYGKVTEYLSGTGLDDAAVTEYEYDTSAVCQQLESHVTWWSTTDLRVCGTRRMTDMISPAVNDLVPQSTYQALLAPNYVRGHFPVFFGDNAPVSKITRKRRSPLTGELTVWKCTEYHNRRTTVTGSLGLYSESVVRFGGIDSGHPTIHVIERPNFQSADDFNRFTIGYKCAKVFVDSITDIEYDELGTAHRVTRHFGYNDHAMRWHLGVQDFNNAGVDTTNHVLGYHICLPDPQIEGRRDASNSLVRTELAACCGEWVRVDHVYSSTSDTDQMRGIDRFWRHSLPVEDVYTCGTYSLVDTHSEETLYSISDFKLSEKYSYRIGRNDADLLMSADVIRLGDGGEWITVDSTGVGSHDYYGNPNSVVRNSSTPVYYAWTHQGTLLNSATSCGQSTYYGWIPLVGCTGITDPSGMAMTYSYSGERLSDVFCAGDKVKSYSYSLHGIGAGGNGFNYVSEKTITNPSNSLGYHTRSYFDGFGNTIGQTADINSWANAISNLDIYDALGRKTRSYVPRQCASPLDVVSAPNIYNDAVPYSTITYSGSTDSRPLSVTIPGQEYNDHPGRMRYLFNKGYAGGAEGPLCCRRYRPGANGGDGTVTLEGYYPQGALSVVETTDGDGRRSYAFTDYRGRLVLTRSFVNAVVQPEGYSVAPQIPLGGWIDTYRVYDDAGDLMFVVTPQAAPSMSAVGDSWTVDTCEDDNPADECYSYRYDKRFRLMSQKAPGCESSMYWYDITGATILSQDGNQRERGVCSFAIPDVLGRAALSGECLFSSQTAESLKDIHVVAERSGSTDAVMGYSLNVALEDADVFVANYYDNYTHLDLECFSRLGGTLADHPLPDHRPNSTGLLTGTWTKVLVPADEPAGGFPYTGNGQSSTPADSVAVANGGYLRSVLSAYCYDRRERLSATVTADHLGGLVVTRTEYSNTDQPIVESFARHLLWGDDSPVEYSYTYDYDDFDRMRSVTLTRGDSTVAISSNTYNSIGKISSSHYGNNCFIGYAFNTSGAMKSMTAGRQNDGFTFVQNLYYATGDTPSYSGNIGYMSWQGADGMHRRYNYTYDGLNRLVSASYLESGSRPENFSTSGARSYSTQYTYWADSRPLTIRRNGITSLACSTTATHLDFGELDNLQFTYSGPHLVKVHDSVSNVVYTGASDFCDAADLAEEYTYDANGNMTSDANKGIVSIEYNALNLPALVTFTDGAELRSVYSADGTLLRRVMRTVQISPIMPFSFGPSHEVMLGSWTIDDHIGQLTYRDGELSRIDTPNGFIFGDEIYYCIKDYQGNIRQVTDADGNVLQDNHYYPYGMLMAESSDILAANVRSTPSLPSISSPRSLSLVNPYLFGGKEYIPFKGANYFDFSARIYDNSTLIFGTPDPYDDDMPWVFSYVYCLGNPAIYVDPFGESPIYSPDGVFLGTDDNGLQGEYYVLAEDVFKQNMPHDEVLKHAIDIKSLDSKILESINSHFHNLPNRPDYDGYLTLEEANEWFRNGNGQPLFVDLSKIDLSGIRSLGESYVGQEKYFNLLLDSGSINDGLVYGNIKLIRLSNNMVKAEYDVYDFDMKPWSNLKNCVRNIETIIGSKLAGEGKPYKIWFCGKAHLIPLFPWIK